jgi:hypothetical protein
MLISAAQALDMMQAHAPRSWSKRLLMWQVLDHRTALYFTSGRRTELAQGQDLLKETEDEEGVESVANVRARYGRRLAARES